MKIVTVFPYLFLIWWLPCHKSCRPKMKRIYVWKTIQCCCSYDLLCNQFNYFRLCEHNIDTPIRVKIHIEKKTIQVSYHPVQCACKERCCCSKLVTPPLMQEGNRDTSRLKGMTKFPGFSFSRNFTVKLFHIQTRDSYLCIFTDIPHQNQFRLHAYPFTKRKF